MPSVRGGRPRPVSTRRSHSPSPAPVTSFMERRIFLAVILGALVMYGWQALMLPPPPPTRPGGTPAQAPTATSPPTETAPPPAQAPQVLATPIPALPPVKGESSEREIVVDTAVGQIV